MQAQAHRGQGCLGPDLQALLKDTQVSQTKEGPVGFQVSRSSAGAARCGPHTHTLGAARRFAEVQNGL